MTVTIVVGLGWGDEGKGKIVDVLAEQFPHVVRGQGGSNAGHTVRIEGKDHFLHLVPSGILTPDTICYIGGGTVVDPESLSKEISSLAESGVPLKSRLFISKYATVIFPFHKLLDQLEEKRKKIGTTGRGIGPAYADSISRKAIRLGECFLPGFKELFFARVAEINEVLEKIYNEPSINREEAFAHFCKTLHPLSPYLTDVEDLLHKAVKKGEKILIEGAQGALLDIVFGTYPFCTSSHTIASGALTGAGLGPKEVDQVVGVVKAFATRVGSGPFPTEEEFFTESKKEIREVGTTTGRERRTGWFDVVMTRFACRLCGVNSIALTKIDILSKLPKIQVCVGYEIDGKVYTVPPAERELYPKIRPVYQELDGWMEPIDQIKSFAELPQKAREYIDFLEDQIGCSIDIVSIGPDRKQTVIRNYHR